MVGQSLNFSFPKKAYQIDSVLVESVSVGENSVNLAGQRAFLTIPLHAFSFQRSRDLCKSKEEGLFIAVLLQSRQTLLDAMLLHKCLIGLHSSQLEVKSEFVGNSKGEFDAAVVSNVFRLSESAVEVALRARHLATRVSFAPAPLFSCLHGVVLLHEALDTLLELRTRLLVPPVLHRPVDAVFRTYKHIAKSMGLTGRVKTVKDLVGDSRANSTVV